MGKIKTMVSPIKYRRMQLGDLDQIYDLEIRTATSPWTRGIFENMLHYYDMQVMLGEQGILGFICMQWVPPTGHLLNIAVEPAHQRKKIAYQTLMYIQERALQQGVTEIFLEVNQKNQAAIALYERLGFQRIGERKQYYAMPDGSREDAWVYKKDT